MPRRSLEDDVNFRAEFCTGIVGSPSAVECPLTYSQKPVEHGLARAAPAEVRLARKNNVSPALAKLSWRAAITARRHLLVVPKESWLGCTPAAGSVKTVATPRKSAVDDTNPLYVRAMLGSLRQPLIPVVDSRLRKGWQCKYRMDHCRSRVRVYLRIHIQAGGRRSGLYPSDDRLPSFASGWRCTAP
ncbi:hypothetical protein DFH11DRAFT_1625914 [Phellopilus nigrolimitatus]|nr:hypothetical protein DFH11DRAFT_1625914 [Phellopilus nigrolimitatus]